MQTCNFGDTYSQGSLFFILICHFLSSPRKTEKPITGLFLLFNHTKSNCRHASETSTHCHCWIPQFKLLKICQSWPPSPGQRNPPSGTAQNFVILEYLVDPWQSRQSSHKILTLKQSLPLNPSMQNCSNPCFPDHLVGPRLPRQSSHSQTLATIRGSYEISKQENETVSDSAPPANEFLPCKCTKILLSIDYHVGHRPSCRSSHCQTFYKIRPKIKFRRPSLPFPPPKSRGEGGSQKFQNRKKFLCQRNPFVQMHNKWLSWTSSPSSTNCQSSHCQTLSTSHKTWVQTNVWTTFSSNKLTK